MLARHRVQRRLQKLTQLWKDYRDMVAAAHEAERITPAEEDRFLRLKAEIAARLQTLKQDVPAAVATETDREVAAMTEMLGNHRSLGDGNPDHADGFEAFTELWHAKYIFLSKLSGARLEERQEPAPRPHVATVPTGYEKSWLPRRRVAGRVSRYLVTVVLLAVAIFIIGWGLGLQRDAEGRFVLEPPSSFGSALDNVTGGLQTAWEKASGSLAPITEAYGPTWTMVLVGLLLLSLAYWIFLRG